VIIDCNERKLNRRVWTSDYYRHYLPRSLVSHEEILTTYIVSLAHCLIIKWLNLYCFGVFNFSFVQLFAQVVYDGHWWFYAINFESNYFIVLDSLPHKCRQKKQIDNNVVIQLLW